MFKSFCRLKTRCVEANVVLVHYGKPGVTPATRVPVRTRQHVLVAGEAYACARSFDVILEVSVFVSPSPS